MESNLRICGAASAGIRAIDRRARGRKFALRGKAVGRIFCASRVASGDFRRSCRSVSDGKSVDLIRISSAHFCGKVGVLLGGTRGPGG